VLVNAGAWPIGSATIRLLKELGAVMMALGDEYLEPDEASAPSIKAPPGDSASSRTGPSGKSFLTASPFRRDAGSKRNDILGQSLLWHARWLWIREREGPARPRVIRIPRDDVGMQVRDAVAEQVVVHLDRSHHVFDSFSDEPKFAPIDRRLLLSEFRRLDYVVAAPDGDGEATLDIRAP
jgi:hypothetical protein